LRTLYYWAPGGCGKQPPGVPEVTKRNKTISYGWLLFMQSPGKHLKKLNCRYRTRLSAYGSRLI